MIEFTIAMQFVLCSLAIWRLTHLIVAEDGPWDIIVRLRAWLGESVVGRAMDCFYCSSVWLAIPFAFIITNDILWWFVCWMALSGAASLLEQSTNRDMNKLQQSHTPDREE
jgi:hypothetical protein